MAFNKKSTFFCKTLLNILTFFGQTGSRQICCSPACVVVWTQPGLPQWIHSPDSETEVGMWRYREMTLKDDCGSIKILADRMTSSLQKLDRRGIFQNHIRVSKEEKVKTTTWPSISPGLICNRTHLVFISKRKLEQHNPYVRTADNKKHLWRMTEQNIPLEIWCPQCQEGLSLSSKNNAGVMTYWKKQKTFKFQFRKVWRLFCFCCIDFVLWGLYF